MIITLDTTKLSNGQRRDVVELIRSFLRKSAAGIREDLSHYLEPEGQAYKDMKGWEEAADEQARSVSNQYLEHERAKKK
jgi:hypothetical protein